MIKAILAGTLILVVTAAIAPAAIAAGASLIGSVVVLGVAA